MSGPSSRYYDRDVSPKSLRDHSGISYETQKVMSREWADESCLMLKRRLTCLSKNPIFLPWDDTGSMEKLPRMLRDRMPNFSYQMQEQQYLEDPEICLAVVGDCTCDQAPIQAADFCPLRGMDPWLERLWLEGGGGRGFQESYEMMAYLGAYKIGMPNATDPYCIFTGDEDYYDVLAATDLKRHFGGQNQRTTATEVFSDLRKAFSENVFLIHRPYNNGGSVDNIIMERWQEVLDPNHIIILPEDEAIVDIILGILAVMGGSRTLDGYCHDMANRKNANTGKPEPQSPGRIAMVRKALSQLGETAHHNNQKPITWL